MAQVICGPIVRHVNRKEANIFIVLDRHPQQVSLNVYSCYDGSLLTESARFKVVALSSGCYAVLANADYSLPDSITILEYDIDVDGESLEDLVDIRSICYPGEIRPSFSVPILHRHFIQSSCRKPHSKGCSDQLQSASGLLQGRLRSENRPSQLFMTGDQIYADDVSPVLLEYIERISDEMGFAREEIPLEGGGGVDPRSLELNGRDSILNKDAGFSSGSAGSHLMAFSEFAAMYILAFGGYSFFLERNLSLSGYSGIESRLKKNVVRSEIDKKRGIRRPSVSKSAVNREKKELIRFLESAGGSVRRLLANISTYMIFDDHEVTDDWNLSLELQKALRESPLGQRVQVNALTNYFVFQHWGNQPEDTGLLYACESHAQWLDNSSTYGAMDLFTKDFGYVLNQIPPVAVLDIRTGRSFKDDEHEDLSLMSVSRTESLKDKVSGLNSTNTLILVSPTPVFGFTKIEQLQRFWRIFRSSIDREAWIVSREAISRLLKAAVSSGAKNVVILSGDVHYGIMRYEGHNDLNAEFFQLCSSPSCNKPVGGSGLLKALEAFGRDLKSLSATYIQPEDSDHWFITPEANIGTLELDGDLTPRRASLLFQSKDGFGEKVFHLQDANRRLVCLGHD